MTDMSDLPHPVTRLGRLGTIGLIAVVLAVCAGLPMLSAAGGVSGLWTRVTGESGTLTVDRCILSGSRSQRTRWTCAGSFAPDGGGAARDVAARTSGEHAPGERVDADASDPSATEVTIRHSAAAGLLLCPLALIAMVVIGIGRGITGRRR